MKSQKPFFKICSPHLSQHHGAVVVLDIGTTGVKAFVFDGQCRIMAKAYRIIGKTRPRKGWVEQDPKEILRVLMTVLKKAVKDAHVPLKTIRGVGVTNQRAACWV